MKYIFSILFLCSSYFSFGQMTLNELMKIYSMDMDQFESYAITKGYEFSNFDKDEDINGATYIKGVGKQTKYLSYYDTYFEYGKRVGYQISNSSELLSIKSQLNSLGFKLFKSYFIEDNQVKQYRNKSFELSIFTIPPNEENNFVTYEISLKKILFFVINNPK